MSMMTLNLAALAAVSHAMAKQDVRYYLNGVLVERDEAGTVTLAAANGHALIAARDPGMAWDADGAAQCILPRDFVGLILKAAKREDSVVIECAEVQGQDARCFDLSATIGPATLRASSIDGRFPYWQQAMAGALVVGAEPRAMAGFDPAVMGVALDAAAAYRKRVPGRYPCGVHFMGAGEATTGFSLTFTGETTICGVVMPMRDAGSNEATRAMLERMAASPAPAALAAAA